MTLGSLRYKIAHRFGLDIANGDQRNLIDDWVYEAVLEFLRETKLVKKTAAMALTSGQGDYELDLSILSFEDLWISPTTSIQGAMLKPVDSSDIRKARLSQSSAPVGTGVSQYALEGENLLMLYPTPGAGQTLNIVYVEKPSVMSGYTSDPSATAFGRIPQEHHPVLEEYVKAKAADYTQDQASQLGQIYVLRYQEGVKRARIRNTLKGGMRFPRAKIGAGSSTVRSPGVDTGG